MLLTFLRHYLGARWRFTRLEGTALTKFQDTLVRRQVAFARTHSPFYRQHWQGSDLSDWQALPTVDKRLMMANFTAFNTRGVDGDAAMAMALAAETSRDFRPTVPGTDLTVGLSTGTSGHRGMFLVSPQEQAAWAGTILARVLPGPIWRRRGWRVTLFHRATSNLYERVRSRRVQLHYHDLMQPLPEAVAALNAEHPHILLGPPTLLAKLADERRAGRLQIQPERVFSVAEVLEPQDAEQIAKAFELAALDQIYQCTEGLLAVSCPHHRLHIMEDLVVIQTEALGEGRAAPLVTDLWRTTQPIIRYRLGDVLTLAPPGRCACGSSFQVIERIEGRQDDLCFFLKVSENKELVPFYPDTVRRAVLLASGQILDYAVRQSQPGEACVFLELAPEAKRALVEDAVRASFTRILASYSCRPATLTFEAQLPPRVLGAKRRRVQNEGKR
nr:F390 synthetase-related protein [Armatimonas sp.]